MRRHEVESVVDVACESLLVEYGLVGRGDYDIGVGVDSCDAVCGPCGAGGGVAVYGFGQDMVVVHLGQLLVHQVEVGHIGVDVYVVQRQHPPHAVKGLLQQRAPAAEEVYELFGPCFTTAGPEASSLASCDDYTVIVVYVSHIYMSVRCGF